MKGTSKPQEQSRMGFADSPPAGEEKRRGALLAAFTACLGAMALGTVVGYASPAVPDINEHHSPFHLGSIAEQSWMVSMIALGGLVGGASSGPLLDRYGRKMIIIVNSVPFVVGWVIIAASPNVVSLYIGRFITGVCAAVIDVAVPIYLAEVSPPDIRGFLGSCHELFVNVGILFVFGFGVFLRFYWLAVACAVLPTMMMVIMCFMPETPRWLVSKGHREAAIQVLKRIRGSRANINAELEEISDNVKASHGKVTWRDFLQPTLYKPMAIVLTLMFVTQFSGYAVVYEYTVTIFSSAGIDMNPYVQTTIVGLSGVLSNLVSAVVVDRTGRRPMLILSAIIMAVSMGTMGLFFLVREKNQPFALDHISWLPILSLISYNFGLNIGFGPIPFYMASELLPLKTRGLTCGISITIWSVFFFIVSRCFMDLKETVHDYGAYWILAAVSTMAVVFVMTKVPETKGKSLEELEEEFKR